MDNKGNQQHNCPVNGKRGFDSEKDARTVINHKGRHLGNPKKLRTYNCEHCGKWHITHMNERDYVPKENLRRRLILHWEDFKKYLSKDGN